ncbi:MAG: hypothetical protein Q9226_000916 [Calogaya cf. arnoldii]
MRSFIFTTVLTTLSLISAGPVIFPGDEQSDIALWPADEQSADEQSDDDCSLSYPDCNTGGLELWNKLHTTLSQANPVDNFANGEAIFEHYYAAAPSESPNPTKRIRQDLANHGFDVRLLASWMTVSKDEQTGKLDTDPQPAYDNDFDTKNGLLVANANFREWDNSQRKLP